MNNSTSLNPLIQKLAELSSRRDKIGQELAATGAELAWFESTSVCELEASLAGATNDAAEVQKSFEAAVAEAKSSETQRDRTSQSVGSILNPGNWFSKEQRRMRKLLKQQENHARRLMDGVQVVRGELSHKKAQVRDFESKVQKFSGFDVERVKSDIDKKHSDSKELEAQLHLLREKSDRIDDALAPLKVELKNFLNQQSNLETQIRTVDSYQRRLDGASNSYEKAMAHQDCEREFGDGKPQRVRSRIDRELSSVKRSIVKIETRANVLAENLARDIHKLVIDGNNLCYESGNQFVGLGPLQALTKVLSKQYEILIVFDAAIRAMIKASDDDIRGLLPDGAQAHVVATRQNADETLLEAASDQKDAYILSNDRFKDFPDKEVVKSGRLIRHEVVDGKAIVGDLNLVVAYQ
jgi:predicted  nucleic acid-binding Zn-ribbon protein